MGLQHLSDIKFASLHQFSKFCRYLRYLIYSEVNSTHPSPISSERPALSSSCWRAWWPLGGSPKNESITPRCFTMFQATTSSNWSNYCTILHRINHIKSNLPILWVFSQYLLRIFAIWQHLQHPVLADLLGTGPASTQIASTSLVLCHKVLREMYIIWNTTWTH